MFQKNMVAKLGAEFVATATLVLVILAVSGRSSFVFFTAMSAGLVLAIMVLAVGPISGAHANPAVTLGLWTRRLIPSSQAIFYITTQMVAGLCALVLYQYLINQGIDRPDIKFDWRIVIAEALGTFVFGFGIMAALLHKLANGAMAATVGGSLALGILVASNASLGVLNPAVAIGTEVTNWAYFVGPPVGAVLGMASMVLIFDAAQPKKKKNIFLRAAKKLKKLRKK